MTPNNTKRKRGRPRKLWSEILRVKLWYLAVSRMSRATDYQLGMLFGFAPGVVPNSADRPRLFENIRKDHKIPGRGSHWRKSEDLVALVAKHPGLESTILLYESDIWHVLEEVPTTLSLANKTIHAFFTKHQLQRLGWVEATQASTNNDLDMDERSCFSHCLKISLGKLYVLDRLTGLILLTRQADMSGNLEMTEILRSHLDESLDLFFSEQFEWQEAVNYYQLVLENVCFGARGGGAGEMDLRASYESITRNPILPIAMVSDFYARQQAC